MSGAQQWFMLWDQDCNGMSLSYGWCYRNIWKALTKNKGDWHVMKLCTWLRCRQVMKQVPRNVTLHQNGVNILKTIDATWSVMTFDQSLVKPLLIRYKYRLSATIRPKLSIPHTVRNCLENPGLSEGPSGWKPYESHGPWRRNWNEVDINV